MACKHVKLEERMFCTNARSSEPRARGEFCMEVRVVRLDDTLQLDRLDEPRLHSSSSWRVNRVQCSRLRTSESAAASILHLWTAPR